MTLVVREETTVRRGVVIRIHKDGSGLVLEEGTGKKYHAWFSKYKKPKGGQVKLEIKDRVVFLIGLNAKGKWQIERIAIEEDYVNGRVNFDNYLSRFQ